MVGAASGLLLLTALLLLLQPHCCDFGPRLGRWSVFYLIQIALLLIFGIGLATVYFRTRATWSVSASLIVIGFYLFLIPAETVAHTRLMERLGKPFYGLLWHVPNPSVRHSLARNCGFLTTRDQREFKETPGNRPRPGIRFQLPIMRQSGEWEWLRLELDRNGFNNPPEVAAQEELDLVFVGDSFTFGLIEPEHNFVSVASRSLDSPILKLGLMGYGPQQERWVIENLAFNWSPKTIVWQFYYNDLSNAAEFEKWLTHYNHLPYSRYLSETRGVFLWHPGLGRDKESWLYFPDMASGLVNAVLCWLRSLLNGQGEELIELPIEDKGRFMVSPLELPQKERLDPDSIREWAAGRHLNRCGGQVEYSMPLARVLAIMEREILRAARACRARGVRLAVMYIPSRLYVYADQVLDYAVETGLVPKEAAARDDYPVFDLLLIDMLKGMADRAGLEYLALPEALREEAAKPGTGLLYFSHDEHLSREGNRVVGEYAASRLQELADG